MASNRFPRDESDRAEILRIRAEYQRRTREISPNFYSWDRGPNYFFHTQLVRSCIAALKREEMFPLCDYSVADIGCGDGSWLLEFAQWEASNLYGIDLDESRIRRAKQQLPAANICIGDAQQLPWSDDSFDLVTQFTMFTSILSESVKRQIASEMVRVVKPSGIIMWFDFQYSNPRNPNVRGIGSSEIHSLFPDCIIRLRRVTLAPPLARVVVPISWITACLLEKIPFLRTHFLGLIRPPSSK